MSDFVRLPIASAIFGEKGSISVIMSFINGSNFSMYGWINRTLRIWSCRPKTCSSLWIDQRYPKRNKLSKFISESMKLEIGVLPGSPRAVCSRISASWPIIPFALATTKNVNQLSAFISPEISATKRINDFCIFCPENSNRETPL